MPLADVYNVFPVHEDPRVDEQDSQHLQEVAGFVDFSRADHTDECGLCRRGICIQRWQVEVGRDPLVIHGSYVA